MTRRRSTPPRLTRPPGPRAGLRSPPPSGRRRRSPPRSSRRSSSTARLPDFTRLGLDDDAAEQLFTECRLLVDNYLRMEDPRAVQAIGLELSLGTQIDGLTCAASSTASNCATASSSSPTTRPGGPPRPTGSCAACRACASTPCSARRCSAACRPRSAAVPQQRRDHRGNALRAGRQLRRRRTAAVWKAVERACLTGDFKPQPTALCELCAFRPWCPAFGGDPERAAVEAPLAFGLTPRESPSRRDQLDRPVDSTSGPTLGSS